MLSAGLIAAPPRSGRVTRVRAATRVLPKQAIAAIGGLRNMAHTIERSQRALCLRVGMPSALSRRTISPILSPHRVHLINTLHHTGLGVDHRV